MKNNCRKTYFLKICYNVCYVKKIDLVDLITLPLNFLFAYNRLGKVKLSNS